MRAAACVVVATPMAGAAPACCARLPRSTRRRVLWLCKGFEAGTGRLGHEIAQRACAAARASACSRARASRSRWRAACRPRWSRPARDAALRRARGRGACTATALRVYTSTDLVGVEVGGAVKNVLAIATGIADGLASLGLNARAALITRGLAEMTRLGVALGARAETFMGLAGLGDLVLTSTGDLSRNRTRRPARSRAGSRCDASSPSSATSPRACQRARWCCERARARGVEMPIADAVVAVLAGRLAPAQALERLLRARSRSARASDARLGAVSRRRRSRSAARPRTPPPRPRC